MIAEMTLFEINYGPKLKKYKMAEWFCGIVFIYMDAKITKLT